jgi:hypothetical protein
MTNTIPLRVTGAPAQMPQQSRLTRRGWTIFIALSALVLAFSSYIVVTTRDLTTLVVGVLIVVILFVTIRFLDRLG